MAIHPQADSLTPSTLNIEAFVTLMALRAKRQKVLKRGPVKLLVVFLFIQSDGIPSQYKFVHGVK